MTDPLARFRRSGAAASESRQEEAAPAGGRERYEAFGTKDRLRALDILMKRVGCSPTYNYLIDVSWTLETETSFILLFSHLAVTVRGRNLGEVVKALRLRKCEFIQEFNPARHDPPADDAPLIEAIEVVHSKDVPKLEEMAPRAGR